MTGKCGFREERASDIARLASNPEQAPLVISAVARSELADLTASIESFLAHTSALTATTEKVEHLISVAERRARGGFIQWVKVLFGAPSREQCLSEAVASLDSVRLRMDSLASIASDVRESIRVVQSWIDGLQDAVPALPGRQAQDAARARVMDLKAMVANGDNAFSPYSELTEKSEALQAWSVRAQAALGS